MRSFPTSTGQHILELGCGFAPLLDFYLNTIGPTGSVTLTDPEPGLDERLAPRLSGRNARFLAGRAEDLAALGSVGSPGGGDGYDMVVMMNVFHHLSDPDAALKSVRALLKGGGVGRLVILGFVFGTMNIFVSPSASEAAKAVRRGRVVRLVLCGWLGAGVVTDPGIVLFSEEGIIRVEWIGAGLLGFIAGMGRTVDVKE